MSDLLNGIAAVLDFVLSLLLVINILAVVISWVGADRSNPVVVMINQITDPIYRLVRPITKYLPGPLDWSPLVVVALVVFLKNSLVPYLRRF